MREEREERDDSQEGKKTKKPKFIMMSFVYTENLVSGKSPVNQESQELLYTVSGTKDQYLYGHERQ